MARARNIKPGFFLNDDLVELRYEVRLLFIGLWTLADREGRLEDRPKKIKMALFPADNIDIDKCLSELGAKGFVLRYEVENRQYIQIVNFLKHQKPHHQEKKSEIPDPTISDEGANQFARYRPDSLIPDSLNTDSLIADSGLLIADSEAPPPDENPPLISPDYSPPENVTQFKKPIPDDWQPSEQTLGALVSLHGIPEPYIAEQAIEFKTYWRERGEQRESWDAVFLQRCPMVWKKFGHQWQTDQPKSEEQRKAEIRKITAGWDP